jgi:TRAP-type C4-dicarboxylate transport system permease large subunit
VGDWNCARAGVQALFTPTEGAAVGVLATAFAALVTGGLTRADLRDAIFETATATGLIFAILLGAQLFNTFLAFTQTPQALAAWVTGLGVAPVTVLLLILVCYLALGCVMDSLSMILLTIPVFFPIVQGLEFGMTPEAVAIWFGILALIVVEIGLITPPVGLNLFIINRLAGDVPLSVTYRGVAPFIAADLVRVAALVAFPGLSLWLVGLIG